MEAQWFPQAKEVLSAKVGAEANGNSFWDKKGVLLVDNLQQGSTINAKHYCALLMTLRQNIKEKCREKVSKGAILLHDNASSHTAGETMAKLKSLGFQVMPHPPYSLDLAPSDYHLFLKLKNT